MSKIRFIDTLHVIALINPRDEFHARAAEFAEASEEQRYLTTDAVLLEIGNALARNFRHQAADVIEHFLTSEDVEVVRLTPGLFEQAFDLYRSHRDKQWGLTDCISFAVMRDAGIDEALTFDHHFLQAGFQALLRDSE